MFWPGFFPGEITMIKAVSEGKEIKNRQNDRLFRPKMLWKYIIGSGIREKGL